MFPLGTLQIIFAGDLLWFMVQLTNTISKEFIDELHTVVDDWDGPTLVGGDFNLIRNIADKNNENINFHWVDAFNNWVNTWGLVELKLPNRSFTWTNKTILSWLCWIEFLPQLIWKLTFQD